MFQVPSSRCICDRGGTRRRPAVLAALVAQGWPQVRVAATGAGGAGCAAGAGGAGGRWRLVAVPARGDAGAAGTAGADGMRQGAGRNCGNRGLLPGRCGGGRRHRRCQGPRARAAHQWRRRRAGGTSPFAPGHREGARPASTAASWIASLAYCSASCALATSFARLTRALRRASRRDCSWPRDACRPWLPRRRPPCSPARPPRRALADGQPSCAPAPRSARRHSRGASRWACSLRSHRGPSLCSA